MGSFSLFLVLLAAPAAFNLATAQPPGSAGHHGSVQSGAANRPPVLRLGGLDGPVVVTSAEEANEAKVKDPNAAPAKNQHMSLSEEGQYSFGYSGASSTRQERRNPDGTVEGTYSYVDPEGKTVKVDYKADAQGFNAYGDNVPPVQQAFHPVPVQDTPEVTAARAEFLQHYDRVLKHQRALQARLNATKTTVSTTSGINSAESDESANTAAIVVTNTEVIVPAGDDSAVKVEAQNGNSIGSTSYSVQLDAGNQNGGVQGSSAGVASNVGSQVVSTAGLPSAGYSIQYDVGNQNGGIGQRGGPVAFAGYNLNLEVGNPNGGVVQRVAPLAATTYNLKYDVGNQNGGVVQPAAFLAPPLLNLKYDVGNQNVGGLKSSAPIVSADYNLQYDVKNKNGGESQSAAPVVTSGYNLQYDVKNKNGGESQSTAPVITSGYNLQYTGNQDGGAIQSAGPVAAAAYNLQLEVGSQNGVGQLVRFDTPVVATSGGAHSLSNNVQLDVNGNGGANTQNVVTFRTGNPPGYFYYSGPGGLPYYVTSQATPFSFASKPVSVRATSLGAFPVAAVHDGQTPHYGGSVRDSKPYPPLYVEVGKDYSVTRSNTVEATQPLNVVSSVSHNQGSAFPNYPLYFPFTGFGVNSYQRK